MPSSTTIEEEKHGHREPINRFVAITIGIVIWLFAGNIVGFDKTYRWCKGRRTAIDGGPKYRHLV